MANFSQLKKAQVTADSTVDFELPELGPKAVLYLRCSGEANSGYMNGLLRLTGQSKGGRRRAPAKVDAKALEAMREHDKELYPKHVVVGWKHVDDAKDKAVEFSVEEVVSLLEQLPDYVFDDMRTVAGDPANFVAVVIDSEEKGKN